MRPDRKQIENAVEKYKKTGSKNFVPVKKLSQKQIENAIASFDKFVKPEKVLALLDTSLFGNGKSGILVSEEKISFSENKNSTIYFDGIAKAECSGDELTAYFISGGRRCVTVKKYGEEAASLINEIAKAMPSSEETENPKAEPIQEIKKPEPKPAPEPEVVLPSFAFESETEETPEKLFEKAKSGDVCAMIDIAKICEEIGDRGCEEKWHEALFWYLRADEEKHVIGSENAARMLEEGIGVPINREVALELYKKSPFKLIKYKELSDDIDEGWCDAIPDKEEYEDFVIWAAEYGEMILDEGIGFDEKFRGFVLVYIAARLGDEDAQYKLANVYGEDSEFVKCDLDKKNYWMNQSYLRGNKKAADYIWR